MEDVTLLYFLLENFSHLRFNDQEDVHCSTGTFFLKSRNHHCRHWLNFALYLFRLILNSGNLSGIYENF